MSTTYDALLILSFGGPERRKDVIPFLENVLRGRNVPRERMLAVAEHYYLFGGKSPINDNNRALIAALKTEFAAHRIDLPIYWGNRNWHPLLADTLRAMGRDGVRRALAFVTSAYSSYSSCRQYLDDIVRARAEVGPAAPEVHKLRIFYNHPGFIEPMIENVGEGAGALPRRGTRRRAAGVHRTQHPRLDGADIPLCRAARGSLPPGRRRRGAQRSNPGLPEPQRTAVAALARTGHLRPPSRHPRSRSRGVVVMPVGFVSDHMETLYDLDTEAKEQCDRLGLRMERAPAVGNHPKFVSMIRELALERFDGKRERRFLGELGLRPDVCAEDCCPRPQRPGAGPPGRR